MCAARRDDGQTGSSLSVPSHEPSDLGPWDSEFESFQGEALGKRSRMTFKTTSMANNGDSQQAKPTNSRKRITETVTVDALNRLINDIDAPTTKPWVDADNAPIWSPSRITVYKVVTSSYVRISMLFVILFNLGLVIYETDRSAKCYPRWKDDIDSCPDAVKNITWLRSINLGLLIIYSFELCLFLFAVRESYFREPQHLLDLFVCIVGWMSLILGSSSGVTWLRILRTVRVFRHPSVKEIKELDMLVKGFGGSMRAIAFGFLLASGALVFSSILLVQYVHPSNVEIRYGDCKRCSRGFETVSAATLTLFQQVIAGDSWGQLSIPNIETNWVAAILLPIVNFVIAVGIMNLILAVIVDRAVEARETKMLRKLRELKDRKVEMLRVLADLDVDNHQVIDMVELEDAFDNCMPFKKLMVHVGFSKNDMADMFEYIDEDNKGEVNYTEFCDSLDSIAQRDAQVLAALTKIKVHTHARNTDKRLRRIEQLLSDVTNRLGISPQPSMHTSIQSPKDSRKKQFRHSKEKEVQEQSGCIRGGTLQTDFMTEALQSFQDLKTEVDFRFQQMKKLSQQLEAENGRKSEVECSSIYTVEPSRTGSRSSNLPNGAVRTVSPRFSEVPDVLTPRTREYDRQEFWRSPSISAI